MNTIKRSEIYPESHVVVDKNFYRDLLSTMEAFILRFQGELSQQELATVNDMLSHAEEGL